MGCGEPQAAPGPIWGPRKGTGIGTSTGLQETDWLVTMYFDHLRARGAISTSSAFPSSLRDIPVIACLQMRKARLREASRRAPTLNGVPPSWASWGPRISKTTGSARATKDGRGAQGSSLVTLHSPHSFRFITASVIQTPGQCDLQRFSSET